jgi:hypothetical protein
MVAPALKVGRICAVGRLHSLAGQRAGVPPLTRRRGSQGGGEAVVDGGWYFGETRGLFCKKQRATVDLGCGCA